MRNNNELLRKARKTAVLFCVFFLFCTVSSLWSAPDQDSPASDGEKTVDRQVTSDDLKRGERLFRGLLPLGPGAESCASCHNTGRIDTFNWNPSALEVAHLYKDRSADELATVLLEPTAAKMMEVHDSYRLTEEEIFLIKAWMDHLAETGIAERPVITQLLLFLVLFVLFAAAVSDLVIFRKIPYKLIHLAVILVTGLFMLKTISHEAIALGRSQYYEPDQPIKFSHQVHVDENKTDCLYCHSVAEYAHTAGIPSVSQCMNCHIIVREGTYSGRFEINKVVDAYESGVPVRWIRVHNLPHHAFFSHAQHVGAAGIDCSECHGEVESTHRVQQVNDLSMGWCLDCHRTREVDIMGNEFYSLYMQLRDDVTSGRINMATARETGGTDCMKCHY